MSEQKLVKIPVVTIDGPGGTGKGTVSQMLAKRYQWHWLDSGLIYRGLALLAVEQGVAFDDEVTLTELAHRLEMTFMPAVENRKPRVYLEKQEVSLEIRGETTGSAASQISVHSLVREALLQRQRSFLKWPGLVTDGRDMGTVVFPQATLKCYLDASLEIRAKRRFFQLKKSGIDASLDQLLVEMDARDKRDQNRGVAPLTPAVDALIIDTSDLTVEAVLQRIDSVLKERLSL